MIDAFEINSIGDGLFVERVLTGLAMLHESGTIAGLAAIGLLLGLFVAVTKGVMTAGRDVDFKYPLIAFCLYSVLFGVTVPVIVVDKVTAPGQTQLQVRGPIDNVPIGAAMAGYLISGIGYSIADRFEDAFSVPGSARVTEGGWGRTLETLAAAREIGAGKFMGTDGFPEFRDSNLRYISDCTLSGMQLDPTQAQKMQADPDPWKGIEYASKFLTTETRLNVDGSPRLPPDMPEMVSCADAMGRLKAGAGNTLKPSFGAYIKGRYGGEVQDAAMDDALKSIGVPASVDAQKYMEASMQAALMAEAVMKGHITSGQTSATLMIQQASEQRRTQWAAEETMLKRVLQPTIGFFEAMLYAVVPFAVFAIGLGPFGLNLAMKYMILALWVQLFMPILAVVNLFQLTAMEHFVNAQMMGNGNNYLTTIHGSWEMQEKALDWLSFGATIAAATPSLALFLLFGGAVAATAMAGRLQGGDHVDEKMASPDALKVGPVQDVAGLNKFDQVSGNRATGSDPTFSNWQYRDEMGRTEQSSFSAASKSAQSFVEKLSAAWNEGSKLSDAARREMSASVTKDFTNGNDVIFTSGSGVQFTERDALAIARANKDSVAIEGKLGTNAKTEEKLRGAAPPAQPTPNGGPARSMKGGVFGALAALVDFSVKGAETAENSTTYQDAVEKLNSLDGNEQQRLNLALSERIARSTQNALVKTGESFTSDGKSTELSKSATDTIESGHAYSLAQTATKAASSGQQLDTAMLASYIVRSKGEAFDDWMFNVRAVVGDAAVNANMHEYEVGHIGDAQQKQAAAALLALAGKGDGAYLLSEHDTPGLADDRTRMFVDVMTGAFSANSTVKDAASIDSSNNANIGDGVKPGAARAKVMAADVGSNGVNPSELSGHFQETGNAVANGGPNATAIADAETSARAQWDERIAALHKSADRTIDQQVTQADANATGEDARTLGNASGFLGTDVVSESWRNRLDPEVPAEVPEGEYTLKTQVSARDFSNAYGVASGVLSERIGGFNQLPPDIQHAAVTLRSEMDLGRVAPPDQRVDLGTFSERDRNLIHALSYGTLSPTEAMYMRSLSTE